jgi:hypothetical protein
VIRLGRTEIVVSPIFVGPPVPDPVGETVVADVTLFSAPAPKLVLMTPSRSFWTVLGRRLLPDQGDGSESSFPNYMELRTRVPMPVWNAIRVASVAAYVALCVSLFVRPAGGLFTFFKVIVPLLPALFFVAPGLWRNICPLAASNQTPRLFGFTRGLTAPHWLRERGYLVAIALFLGIASARLAFFNRSATGTGVLLSIAIVTAFLGGLFLKGKSGWCSSICPLLPLQRVYGQTPFVTVPNGHCDPCVGCAKNCYDFKPQVAYQADLHDPDPNWTSPRILFASILPGFVLGFFTLADKTGLTNVHLYERLGLYALGSAGSFFAIDALLPLTTSMVTALYGSAAINIFYWFASVTLANSFATITGLAIPWVRWPIRGVVYAFTLAWIIRTHLTEQRFIGESVTGPQPIKLASMAANALRQQVKAAQSEVRFLPDDQPVPAEAGLSLLELAEKDGRRIEAGCRMGVCGADPVAGGRRRAQHPAAARSGRQ